MSQIKSLILGVMQKKDRVILFIGTVIVIVGFLLGLMGYLKVFNQSQHVRMPITLLNFPLYFPIFSFVCFVCGIYILKYYKQIF